MKKQLIIININGQNYDVIAAPNTTLLWNLREQLGLMGTKEGCEMGTCGCCTVLLDGRPVLACLTLTVHCQNKAVLTIEGLSEGDELTEIQQAFLRHGAVQCGYCTPGMILSATALVKENPKPSVKEIQKGIEGNICRCTGYNSIINAIQEATEQEIHPKY